MTYMVANIPDGYLSKPEALEKFQKPERTFQRRLAKAIQTQNKPFLNHFLLITSDGQTRSGDLVEVGDVDRFKSEGLYPVWYVEEKWFANEYDRKSTKKAQAASEPQSNNEPTPASIQFDRSNLDRTALVREIESLNRELERERQHNETITNQLSIKDEQILAANSVVIESNQREKEYSRLLQELAGRIPSLDSAKQTATVEDKPQATSEVQPIEADVVLTKSETTSNSQAKKKAIKKPSTGKKKSPSKKKAKVVTKPKWYEVPTVRRMFSRQDG